jgi:hypothetical protein
LILKIFFKETVPPEFLSELGPQVCESGLNNRSSRLIIDFFSLSNNSRRYKFLKCVHLQ